MLGASVALNLFLLAVIGGGSYVISQNMQHYQRAMRGINEWRAAVKELPPQERDQVFALLKSAGLSGEQDMTQARNLRAQVTTVVSKTPYDVTQATILSEQARNAEDSARSKIENALILGMKTMTPAQRTFISTQVLRPSLRFSRLGTHPPQKPGDNGPGNGPGGDHPPGPPQP